MYTLMSIHVMAAMYILYMQEDPVRSGTLNTQITHNSTLILMIANGEFTEKDCNI